MAERTQTSRAAGLAVVARDPRDGKLKILLGKRGLGTLDHVGTWSIPAGAVDEGESLEAAARRELVEETGRDWALSNMRAAASAETASGVFATFIAESEFVAEIAPSGRFAHETAEFRWVDLDALEAVDGLHPDFHATIKAVRDAVHRPHHFEFDANGVAWLVGAHYTTVNFDAPGVVYDQAERNGAALGAGFYVVPEPLKYAYAHYADGHPLSGGYEWRVRVRMSTEPGGYLSWVSPAAPELIERLEKNGVSVPPVARTSGRELYAHLTDALGGEKAANEMLLAAGCRGVVGDSAYAIFAPEEDLDRTYTRRITLREPPPPEQAVDFLLAEARAARADLDARLDRLAVRLPGAAAVARGQGPNDALIASMMRAAAEQVYRGSLDSARIHALSADALEFARAANRGGWPEVLRAAQRRSLDYERQRVDAVEREDNLPQLAYNVNGRIENFFRVSGALAFADPERAETMFRREVFAHGLRAALQLLSENPSTFGPEPAGRGPATVEEDRATFARVSAKLRNELANDLDLDRAAFDRLSERVRRDPEFTDPRRGADALSAALKLMWKADADPRIGRGRTLRQVLRENRPDLDSNRWEIGLVTRQKIVDTFVADLECGLRGPGALDRIDAIHARALRAASRFDRLPGAMIRPSGHLPIEDMEGQSARIDELARKIERTSDLERMQREAEHEFAKARRTIDEATRERIAERAREALEASRATVSADRLLAGATGLAARAEAGAYLLEDSPGWTAKVERDGGFELKCPAGRLQSLNGYDRLICPARFAPGSSHALDCRIDDDGWSWSQQKPASELPVPTAEALVALRREDAIRIARRATPKRDGTLEMRLDENARAIALPVGREAFGGAYRRTLQGLANERLMNLASETMRLVEAAREGRSPALDRAHDALALGARLAQRVLEERGIAMPGLDAAAESRLRSPEGVALEEDLRRRLAPEAQSAARSRRRKDGPIGDRTEIS